MLLWILLFWHQTAHIALNFPIIWCIWLNIESFSTVHRWSLYHFLVIFCNFCLISIYFTKFIAVIPVWSHTNVPNVANHFPEKCSWSNIYGHTAAKNHINAQFAWNPLLTVAIWPWVYFSRIFFHAFSHIKCWFGSEFGILTWIKLIETLFLHFCSSTSDYTQVLNHLLAPFVRKLLQKNTIWR